jgi:hypothetical protein
VPLYLAGARLEANYPFSVITDGMGLNITVMSYCGHLDFGIVSDRDQIPDVWSMMDWLGDAMSELAPKTGGRSARDGAARGKGAGGKRAGSGAKRAGSGAKAAGASAKRAGSGAKRAGSGRN